MSEFLEKFKSKPCPTQTPGAVSSTSSPYVTTNFVPRQFECGICLNRILQGRVRTSCKHNFHRKCICKWLIDFCHNSCPICRNDLEIEKPVLSRGYVPAAPVAPTAPAAAHIESSIYNEPYHYLPGYH